MEKKEEVKEEKVSEVIAVVSELPKQELREGLVNEGKTLVHFIPIEEALTEILTLVREIKKGVNG
ncbi:MAG: hypothetical protein M0R17_06130 [Candidatus Omnitrophica bacterium]|jgi:hypothetical protein|nr:hypothetical protein [Candidatus Omnitrophota bacterium]